MVKEETFSLALGIYVQVKDVEKYLPILENLSNHYGKRNIPLWSIFDTKNNSTKNRS